MTTPAGRKMKNWLQKKTLTQYGFGEPVENWVAILIIIFALFMSIKVINKL